MNYFYKSRCFQNESEYLAAAAADCFDVTGNLITSCVVSGSELVVSTFSVSTQTTDVSNMTLPQIDCLDLTADYVELSWKIVLVWVIAWGFKVLYKAITQ